MELVLRLTQTDRENSRSICDSPWCWTQGLCDVTEAPLTLTSFNVTSVFKALHTSVSQSGEISARWPTYPMILYFFLFGLSFIYSLIWFRRRYEVESLTVCVSFREDRLCCSQDAKIKWQTIQDGDQNQIKGLKRH